MITEQHNGSEAAAYLNAALQDAGSEVTIGNENGQSIATKLNGVFADTLITESLSGSEFAQAVEDGFDGMEPPTPHDTLRLLHISDAHGWTSGLQECYEMLAEDDGIANLIISGDLTQYSTYIYTADTLSILENIKALAGGKLLMVKGNHDIYDNGHGNLANVSDIVNYSSSSGKLINNKKFLMAMMGHHEEVNGQDTFVSNVNWGNLTLESTNASAYWYKDIQSGDHTLRIIGIDDYETASKFDSKPIVAYKQAQVNWLLNLLADTPSSYHILMVTHESPFKESGTHAAALSFRPQNAEEAAGEKLFVSVLHDSFHERENEVSVNLLPIIMKAYLHKENLDTTWENNNTNTGFGTLTLKKDFSETEPATLVGYVFGHLHRDTVGYMPHEDYSDQLLLGITATESACSWSGTDDLLWGFYGSDGKGWQWARIGSSTDDYSAYGGQVVDEPTYRINELVIDFTANTLTIKRHGNKSTAAKNSKNGADRIYGTRVRNEVTFNFNTGQS